MAQELGDPWPPGRLQRWAGDLMRDCLCFSWRAYEGLPSLDNCRVQNVQEGHMCGVGQRVVCPRLWLPVALCGVFTCLSGGDRLVDCCSRPVRLPPSLRVEAMIGVQEPDPVNGLSVAGAGVPRLPLEGQQPC